jgi:hypothetical protein
MSEMCGKSVIFLYKSQSFTPLAYAVRLKLGAYHILTLSVESKKVKVVPVLN